jgi:hypothetical protein
MTMSDDSEPILPPVADSVNKQRPVIAGEDYYLEGNILVFTAAYHLRRGYCCGNGCRHCPYP